MKSLYVKNTLLNFFSFFLIAFSLYIFIALVSYDPTDPAFFNKSSSLLINNLGGPLGPMSLIFIYFNWSQLFSYFAYWMCLGFADNIFRDQYGSNIKTIVRLLSSFILLISFCAVLEYYFDSNSGGFLGKFIFTNLSNSIGFLGV